MPRLAIENAVATAKEQQTGGPFDGCNYYDDISIMMSNFKHTSIYDPENFWVTERSNPGKSNESAILLIVVMVSYIQIQILFDLTLKIYGNIFLRA